MRRLIIGGLVAVVGSWWMEGTAQPLASNRPLRHALYSAVIPGAGQAANRKYWKIPIIYAGLGATTYGWHYYRTQYLHFREAYRMRTDGDSSTIDPYDPSLPNGMPKYSEATLLEIVSYYRRNRDLMVMAAGGVYLLNVLDAFVDAHLADFDIRWEAPPGHTAGVRIQYRFSPRPVELERR